MNGRGLQRAGAAVRLVALGAAVALGVACDARFVDPFPPDLERLPRQATVGVVDAPVVYQVVLDLHLPDAAECDRTQTRLITELRSTLLPSGRAGQALPIIVLAPDCRQPARRDVTALQVDRMRQRLAGAQQTYGADAVKPQLVYLNNVKLSAPPEVRQAFGALRSEPIPWEVWTIATPEVNGSSTFDHPTEWTYSADPALTTKLREAADKVLPLQQLASEPTVWPLFSATELSRVLQFKTCSVPRQLRGINYPVSQRAFEPVSSEPPRFRLELARPLGARGTVQPLVVNFDVEVCHAQCSGRFDPPEGPLVQWNTTAGCVLPQVTAP